MAFLDKKDIIPLFPGHIYWKDKEGIYLGCNEEHARFLGFNSSKEIIGKTDFDLCWRAVAKELRAADKKVMETGKTELFEEPSFTIDGRRIIYLSKKAPLRDDKDNVIGVIGISIDISELKNKEQQLELANQEKSNFLKGIIPLFPGHIYWKNKDGIYLGCNEEHAWSLGLNSSQEVIGRTDFDLCWHMVAKKLQEADKEVMRTGKQKLFEEPLVLSDDRKVVYLSKKVPLCDDKGKIIGVIGTSIDITGIKNKELRLEEAVKKSKLANQAKSNFLAVVSHELRTPLNGILGTTQIVAKKIQDLELREHIKDIEQAAINLLTLVNDILDFSRTTEGKLVIHEGIFDIKQVIKEAVSDIKYKLSNKPIDLYYECDPKIPKYLVGDAFRIKQILLNLIGNAIKFTDKGEIKVTVSCEKITQKIAKLKIAVKDTGVGISKDMQEKIFERFTQIESDYNRSYEGFGLGLSICRQILNSMGGKMDVESELGKGSTFWIKLHLKISNKMEYEAIYCKRNELEELKGELPDQINANVLLVEDNALNQKIAKILLEELGCHVDIVDNGKQAIESNRIKQYDIIFMDVGLPDMDGISITKAIRKENIHQNVPIIALTAHALEQDRERCLQASMNDVLTKPIKSVDLKRILAQCVDEKRKVENRI